MLVFELLYVGHVVLVLCFGFWLVCKYLGGYRCFFGGLDFVGHTLFVGV